jgi:hypothetical protein
MSNNLNILKKAQSGKVSERKEAAKLLQMVSTGRHVKDLTDEELAHRLHVLREGTPDQVSALEPLVYPSYLSNLTDEEIKQRLNNLEYKSHGSR